MQDIFENFGIGFQQMEAVGKINMIEKVGSMVAFIGKTGLFRPVPMWPFNLSVRLPIVALVGRYLTN